MDLLGEQALAADLGQAAVLDAVAGGADDLRMEHVVQAQHWAELGEAFEEPFGLDQRQRAATGAGT